MAATITRSTKTKAGKGGSPLSITYRGHFTIPDAVLNHPDFYSLSGNAMKVLILVGAQYNGRNNGDLQCTRSVMASVGLTSDDMRNKGLKELEKQEWLVKTKQGGRGIGPNLYALTWQPIHECGGKHDLKPTTKAYRSLKQ